jgi:hypothetical protein
MLRARGCAPRRRSRLPHASGRAGRRRRTASADHREVLRRPVRLQSRLRERARMEVETSGGMARGSRAIPGYHATRPGAGSVPAVSRAT